MHLASPTLPQQPFLRRFKCWWYNIEEDDVVVVAGDFITIGVLGEDVDDNDDVVFGVVVVVVVPFFFFDIVVLVSVMTRAHLSASLLLCFLLK